MIAVDVMNDSPGVYHPAILAASGPAARAFVRSFVNNFSQPIQVPNAVVKDFSAPLGTEMLFGSSDVIVPLVEHLTTTGTFNKGFASSLSFLLFPCPLSSALPGTKSSKPNTTFRPGEFLAAVITSSSNVSNFSGRQFETPFVVEEYYTQKASGLQNDTALVKATWSQAFVNNLPDSSFLWIAPGGTKEDGKTMPRSLRYFPYKDASGTIDLPHLRNAIARIPQAKHEDLTPEKKASLQKKAQAILESANKESFTVWHDKEKNQWRWFAIYSNKFRDNDNPPEIIADHSHRDFVKSVEAGLIPYPELWLWHVPGSKVGQSDWLAYTDEGFALASGYFENEQVAKALSVYPDGLRTSHGMPSSSIKRDLTDKSIIIQHVTKEISPLPSQSAANKLTDFINFVLKEEGEEMAIPQEKIGFLKQAGLTDEQIAQIENGVKEKATQAEAEKLEYKEALTPETIVKAIETYFSPLATRLEVIESAIKELQQSDAAKIADKAVSTPKLSLEALAQQRVGGLFSQANQISGNSALARSGPKQTKAKEQQGLFFQPWMQPAGNEVNE